MSDRSATFPPVTINLRPPSHLPLPASTRRISTRIPSDSCGKIKKIYRISVAPDVEWIVRLVNQGILPIVQGGFLP